VFFSSKKTFNGNKKSPVNGPTAIHHGLRSFVYSGGKMKVILKENIENLGKRGDIIDVAAGYGRNYLLPKNIALRVTPSNMKMIEMEQKALRKKLEKEMSSYNEIIGRLNQTTLTFKRKVGEKESLFGSVSVADIKEALDVAGFEIEKRKILLSEPIKTLGQHTVPVKIFHDDKAELKIAVLEEGAEEKPEAGIESVKTKETTQADEQAEDISVMAEKEQKQEAPLEPVEPEEESKETAPAEVEADSETTDENKE
jgi:large subunit ribosomal protein L9